LDKGTEESYGKSLLSDNGIRFWDLKPERRAIRKSSCFVRTDSSVLRYEDATITS